MKNYAVGDKVFKTEDEARSFSRDLMAMGALGGWNETYRPVTHYYLGNLMAEPVEDFFGLIKEHKEAQANETN